MDSAQDNGTGPNPDIIFNYNPNIVFWQLFSIGDVKHKPAYQVNPVIAATYSYLRSEYYLTANVNGGTAGVQEGPQTKINIIANVNCAVAVVSIRVEAKVPSM